MGGQDEHNGHPGRDLNTEIVGTWGPEALNVMRAWPLPDVVAALGEGHRLYRARHLLDDMDMLTLTREINTGTRSLKPATSRPDVTTEPYQKRRDELMETITPGYLQERREQEAEAAYLAELDEADTFSLG